MPPDAPQTPFELLETEWARLYTAWGERVVAEHSGGPIDDVYPQLRRAFDASLAEIPRSGLSPIERAGLATIESALPGLDDYVAVGGLEAAPDTGAEPEIDAVARATLVAFGEAAAAIDTGADTIDRLTAFTRLASEPNAGRRRALFEAMAPVYRTVDGDGDETSPYRRIVRASAERWARDGSVIEANALVLGIAPGTLEPMLWAALDAGRALLGAAAGPRPIEPWDYRYLVGAAERHLADAIPLERLRAINAAHLRALGADPDDLRITYDFDPRPGRPIIPLAFTIGVGIPARPWVFATYEVGGLSNLAELIHESGHAIHVAAIDTRPCFAEPPVDHAAFFEAIADLIGWDASEPAFQRHHLGIAADHATARLDRYGAVLLDICWALFEIELHRSPDRRPNDVWTEITRDGLGISAHPEWSWWAVRGQLIEAPGYMANYALSAIAAAALRDRLRELRGDWSAGDPGWYPFVADRLLRYGGERPPADLLHELLGGPLTADAMLADMAG
jgi:hypothetical protein